MLLIDNLAEENIQAAIRRGEFDDLPGQGRRLELDDETLVPEALRAGYRLLRNAGCLPPELTLRREIHEIETLLRQAEGSGEQAGLRRRLQLLQTRLALRGHESSLLERDAQYRAKIMDRLDRDAGRASLKSSPTR